MSEGTPTVPRSRAWGFTWNNYPLDFEAKLRAALAAAGAAKWVFQAEVGAEGTPHIQGVLCFSAQKTATAWQPAFNTAIGGIAIHYDTVRNFKSRAKYCCKEDTAVGGSFSNCPEYVRSVPDDDFDLSIATPWQKEVIELAEAPPQARVVYWYWGDTGNAGKSFLARHLCIKYRSSPRTIMLCAGSAKDAMYAIASAKEKHGRQPRMVLWDLPRAHKCPDFSGVEMIKNGCFFSSKYESDTVILDHYPHIVVFSNYSPEEAKLTSDRWKITCIDE